MDSLIKEIEVGNIDSFWELCTNGIHLIYQLCRLNNVPDNETEAIIESCVRTVLFDFDKIVRENDIRHILCEEFEKEFYKRYSDKQILLMEDNKFESKLSNSRIGGSIANRACDMQGYKNEAVSDNEGMPAEMLANLTMELGIYNKNSDIAVRFMALHEKNKGHVEADSSIVTKPHQLSYHVSQPKEELSDFTETKKKKTGTKRTIIAFLIIIAFILSGSAVYVAGFKKHHAKTEKHQKESEKKLQEEYGETLYVENSDDFESTYMEDFRYAEWQYEPEESMQKFENVVFPSVHDENNGECTFIWGKTEQDIRLWIEEQYRDYIVTNGSVDEIGGNRIIDKRIYHETRCESDDSEAADIDNYEISVDCDSSGYSSKYVSSVNFGCRCSNPDEMMECMTDFLEFMGLGDYAEDIIKTPSFNVIVIDTENGLGEYHIQTSYLWYKEKEEEIHDFGVKVEYEDTWFDNYSIIPENMMNIDDAVTPSEWFPASRLELSGIIGFSQDLNYYIKGLETGNYTYTHSYNIGTDEDFDKEGRYEFLYYNKSRYDSISVNKEDEYISMKIRPYEYYKVSGYRKEDYLSTIKPSELTDDTAEKIAVERLDILSVINPDFGFTLEDIGKNLKTNWDRDEEEQVYLDKVFENGAYTIELKNDLNEFELKICKMPTE